MVVAADSELCTCAVTFEGIHGSQAVDFGFFK
jgi:hypothetical protein